MAKKRRRKSMRAYFVEQFNQHPEWLELSDNSALVDQWMADHGGKAMPAKVKKSMATCKSSLRNALRSSNGRRKGGRKKLAVLDIPARSAVSGLDDLDAMIDKCLVAARDLNVIGIEPVLKHLRVAQAHIILLFDEK